ncbi:MAG TPA: SAP domain-containing protein [Saprospiraceae bacterium]|nr:SAP domain-containing protein [Saprospiraceae bacterium]
MSTKKFIGEIIEEHFPAEKAPKWVNYKAFKALMEVELKKDLLYVIKDDGKYLNIYWFLFPYISDNVDPGVSSLVNAFDNSEILVKIPDDVIKVLSKSKKSTTKKASKKTTTKKKATTKKPTKSSLESLTVVKLKAELKKKGLSTVGKKAILVQRLKDAEE